MEPWLLVVFRPTTSITCPYPNLNLEISVLTHFSINAGGSLRLRDIVLLLVARVLALVSASSPPSQVAPATEAAMASEAADRAFWPPIARIFDFTLKFEESIFSIAPSGLAILVIACMVFYYLRKPTVVRKGLLLWLKLVSCFSPSSLGSCAVYARPATNP